MKIKTSNIEILKGNFSQTIAKIEGYLQEANGASKTNVDYTAKGVYQRMEIIKSVFFKELHKLSESIEQ